MRREIDLTENDILAALEEAMTRPVMADDPPGAMTIEDIAEALDRSYNTVRAWVRKLKRAGVELEVVEVTRINIMDEPYTTKALRLKIDDNDLPED